MKSPRRERPAFRVTGTESAPFPAHAARSVREDPLAGFYLWIKALHVIAVIAWMAGILYLPRLFVYHAQAEVGSPSSETFKVMEAKLYGIIMTPAMIVAWVCGLSMIAMNPALMSSGWL